MYGTAPQIGIWFNSDALVEVLRWVAFSFILSSIALVPRSLPVRHMDFKRLFAAAMVAMVIGNLGIGLRRMPGMAFGPMSPPCSSQNTLLGLCFWWMRPPGTVLGGTLAMDRSAGNAAMEAGRRFSIGSTTQRKPTRCLWENLLRPTLRLEAAGQRLVCMIARRI